VFRLQSGKPTRLFRPEQFGKLLTSMASPRVVGEPDQRGERFLPGAVGKRKAVWLSGQEKGIAPLRKNRGVRRKSA